MTIEKTPSYFVKREVPARIHQMSPAIKLIVVVRDPTTRAISGPIQEYTSLRRNSQQIAVYRLYAIVQQGSDEEVI